MSDVPPYDKLLCFISCTLTTSQVTMTTKRCSHGYNTLCDSMWSIYIFIWYNKQCAGFAIISCVQYLQAGFIAEKGLRVSSCISIIGFEISFLTNVKLNFLTMCLTMCIYHAYAQSLLYSSKMESDYFTAHMVPWYVETLPLQGVHHSCVLSMH